MVAETWGVGMTPFSAAEKLPLVTNRERFGLSEQKGYNIMLQNKILDYSRKERQQLCGKGWSTPDAQQDANRFYLEDLAIGLMRPSFNVDIER
jgi:hypothetical protein